MEGVRDVGMLIGRVLLVLIFVISGFEKLTNASGTMAQMSAHGIPFPPLALAVSILVEFGCGLLVMIGYQARWAALVIFLWFIPVTLIFHVAGYRQALAQHQAMTALIQQIMYMKNISIMGGLLMVFSTGAGALSIDGRGSAAEAMGARRAA